MSSFYFISFDILIDSDRIIHNKTDRLFAGGKRN